MPNDTIPDPASSTRGPRWRRRWPTAGSTGPAMDTPPDSGASPNRRRIVVDLHDEYARHAGHAGLMREAVGGLAGEDPPR